MTLGTATPGALRRAEKPQPDPVWRYQISSKLLQPGSISTTLRGMSFFLASEQHSVTIMKENYMKVSFTLSFHGDQK